MYRSLAITCWTAAAMVCQAGSIIVGVALTDSRPLYQINTMTGAATALGTTIGSPNIPLQPLTGGPPNSLYTWLPFDPFNLVKFDLSTGTWTHDSTAFYLILGSAYDVDHGTMWRTVPASTTGLSYTSLWSSPTYGGNYPGNGNNGAYVGPTIDCSLLDYAPATGLLCLSSGGLYRLNQQTGAATFLTNISLPPLTMPPLGLGIAEFAYDDATGKLIVAALDNPVAPGRHALYSVDLQTGMGTLLTDQGPAIIGLARVDIIPEPATFVMFALGLGLLMFLSIPRNFGEAFVSELKHWVERWIAHV